MKNGIFYIALLVLLSACQPSQNKTLEAQLKPDEAVFIQGYQTILNDYLKEPDDTIFREKLTKLLRVAPTQSNVPHILQVQTDIQIQLGHFDEAIKSNNSLFYVQPHADTRYLNCTLFELAKRSDKDIKNCYSQAAQLYKKASSKYKPASSEFQDQYFFYQLSMLQAGYDNFHEKIKEYISTLPDEKQDDFNDQYEMVAKPQEHTAFLESVRQGQWMRIS